MRLRLSLAGGHESFVGERTEHVFDKRGGVIGRGEDCDWVLDCSRKLVSRRHAMVVCEDGEFFIYDASSNGLFHNGSNEPIGPGWRVAVGEGDSLRLGDFVLSVQRLPAGAPAAAVPAASAEPEATPVVASLLPEAVPEPELEREALPAPVALPRPAAEAAPARALAADLGDSRDVFQPPAAAIPEDWDPGLGQPEREPAPLLAVAEQLGELESEPGLALWQALRLDAAERPPALTPELAQALGECLRVSLQAVFRLKADGAAAEQKLLGRATAGLPGGAALVDDFATAEGFLAALLAAPDRQRRDRLLTALAETAGYLRGRQTAVADCLDESLAAVVEQFAPARFEQRYQQFLADRGQESWLERLRRRWNPGAAYWGFYRFWYASQRRSAFASVYQLFEKKFAALYSARRRGGRPHGGEAGH